MQPFTQTCNLCLSPLNGVTSTRLATEQTAIIDRIAIRADFGLPEITVLEILSSLDGTNWATVLRMNASELLSAPTLPSPLVFEKDTLLVAKVLLPKNKRVERTTPLTVILSGVISEDTEHYSQLTLAEIGKRVITRASRLASRDMESLTTTKVYERPAPRAVDAPAPPDPAPKPAPDPTPPVSPFTPRQPRRFDFSEDD